MAQQIKNFWFKLGTMFLTLYFAPLSDFIMGLIGVRSGGAIAGTIRCTSTGGTRECGGQSSQTVSVGTTLQCTCVTDSSKVEDVECIVEQDTASDGTGRDVYRFVSTGLCYSKSACLPNGMKVDCSTASQYGTKTCVGGKWGPCQMGDCKSGYIKVGGSCFVACNMSNGSGYEMDIEESSSSSTMA